MSGARVFRLEPDDDMASLRQRLNSQQVSTAIVLVPAGATLLREAVNMRLLRRWAEQTATSILVVTNDRPTVATARQVGVPVSGKIPRHYLSQLPSGVPVPALPRRRTPFYRWLAGLSLWLVGLAVLTATILLVGGVALVLAPAASVTLVPAVDTLETVVDITSGMQIRAIDSAKGQVPAQAIQVLIEDTGQAATTGRKRVPDAAATGTVVFANRSLNAQTIAKGTVVRTATGVSIRFRTEEEALLPAAAGATVRVPVKAVDPGSTGNVKAGTISIVEGPLAFQVSVLNDEDCKGGTEREARFVTLADRNRLRDLLLEKIRAGSYATLRATIGPDDILPAESLIVTVNETSFDKPLDAEADYLTGKMRATVSGLVLQGDDVKKLVVARLRDHVRDGFELLPGGVSYSAPTNITYSEGIVTLRIAATAQSRARVAAQEARNMVVGMTQDEAERALAERFQLGRPPHIELKEARLGRMPFLAARINVQVVNQ